MTKREDGDALPYTNDKDKNETKVIERKEGEKRREGLNKRKKRFIIIGLAVAAVIFLIVFFAAGGYEKILDLFGIERDVKVTPKVLSVEAEIKGTPVLAGKGGVSIVYDEQGVTGYGVDGKWKWHVECSVNNPGFTDCGDFAVIADIGGTAAYAFDKNGAVWKYGSGNVIKSVFGRGKYVCIVHEEKEYLSAATVYEFESKTSTLKELFTRKFGSHYILTGAISKDCKQMVLSGVFSDSGEARGSVSFIRLSDGEIFANEDVNNNIYVRMFYSDNNTVFAANSDSVQTFYKSLSVSTDGDKKSELWSRNNMQSSITDVAMVENKYCLVAIGNDSADKTTVKAFDASGKEKLSFEVSGNVIGVDSVGDTFMVYTKTHVSLYNSKGLFIGTAEAGFKIDYAVCADSRNVAVCGEGKLLTVSFN